MYFIINYMHAGTQQSGPQEEDGARLYHQGREAHAGQTYQLSQSYIIIVLEFYKFYAALLLNMAFG